MTNIEDDYQIINAPNWYNPDKISFLSGLPIIGTEARIIQYINGILGKRNKDLYERQWKKILNSNDDNFFKLRATVFHLIERFFNYENSFFFPNDVASIVLRFIPRSGNDPEDVILELINCAAIDQKKEYLLDILDIAEKSSMIELLHCLKHYNEVSSTPPVINNAIKLLGVFPGLLFEKNKK